MKVQFGENYEGAKEFCHDFVFVDKDGRAVCNITFGESIFFDQSGNPFLRAYFEKVIK